jgi:hypothetical protein
MLKGMESIDASLANQFNQKGESFKDVFISILGFITNGIVAPLLISAANPKYLTMAANQITALADLTGDLGPVMIGFFKSMEKLMEYVESKYGADSGNVLSFMADIFDNKFFTGNLIETFDKTIKNLEKLIEIDNLINQLTGFDVNSLSHIFADVDTSTLNLDAMEIAMIDFGDQLDRIIAIMNDNVNRINKINELGEISVNSGKISTAPTAEIPESQAVDMYAKNIQMKESSGSNSESYDELVELNQINESIDSKQSQMIELLGGILRALNVPISVGGKEGESAGAPEKTFNLQEYTSAFSAKLQTGTTSRSAYVKGSNMMVTNSGPFTKRK